VWYLFFFDIRTLITPVVSSNSSYRSTTVNRVVVHVKMLMIILVFLEHQRYKASPLVQNRGRDLVNEMVNLSTSWI
jgi:hypothetical protein